MRYPEIKVAMDSGKPYFGNEMAARQGAPRRHAYMQMAVKVLATEGTKAPLVLEIGSWAGGSAVTWARALEKYCTDGRVFCIDHWRPYFDLSRNTETVYRNMDEASRSELILELFFHNVRACGVEGRVIPIRGGAREVLPVLAREHFDIVFIDGSHTYHEVKADIQESLLLLRDGGILCGDDLELQLSQCDRHSIERMADENRDWVFHPGVRAHFHPGVTLAVGEILGEVSSWEGFWAVRKRGDQWGVLTLPDPGAGYPDHF